MAADGYPASPQYWPIRSTLAMSTRVPSEISFDWVYFPPFFFTVVVGYLCAFGIARLLNTTGLSRYFWHSGLTFVALWVLLTSLIGLVFIPP